jgi:hypothetical protein
MEHTEAERVVLLAKLTLACDGAVPDIAANATVEALGALLDMIVWRQEHGFYPAKYVLREGKVCINGLLPRVPSPPTKPACSSSPRSHWRVCG